MSRSAIFTLLTTDPALQALGMTSSAVFGAAVAQSPEVRPFAVLKYGDDTAFIGSVSSQTLELWVYDEPGSYERINSIIDRAITLLCVEKADVVAGGGRFGTAKWRSTSRDLYDDIYKCVTRYATFSVV